MFKLTPRTLFLAADFIGKRFSTSCYETNNGLCFGMLCIFCAMSIS